MAYIVFGLSLGVAMGWLLSRVKSESKHDDSEQELNRLKAIIEARNEAFQNTREQLSLIHI